jgi:predicted metal-binding membrane protein
MTAATAAALMATLGLALVCWVALARRMTGMDPHLSGMHQEAATGGLEPFLSFVGLWVTMMAAMMLPGVAPAVVTRARAKGQLGAGPLFVGWYLVVWTLAGVLLFGLFQFLRLPVSGTSLHGSPALGSLAAGLLVIAAGVYELTPVKLYFRRRCQERVPPGFEFGLHCVGSCIGLMFMLMALGFMSAIWMSVITVLVLAQKLLPAKALIDVPVALAIIWLGSLIVTASPAVTGFTQPMP